MEQLFKTDMSLEMWSNDDIFVLEILAMMTLDDDGKAQFLQRVSRYDYIPLSLSTSTTSKQYPTNTTATIPSNPSTAL